MLTCDYGIIAIHWQYHGVDIVSNFTHLMIKTMRTRWSDLELIKDAHNSPSVASYGAYFINFDAKNNREIRARRLYFACVRTGHVSHVSRSNLVTQLYVHGSVITLPIAGQLTVLPKQYGLYNFCEILSLCIYMHFDDQSRWIESNLVHESHMQFWNPNWITAWFKSIYFNSPCMFAILVWPSGRRSIPTWKAQRSGMPSEVFKFILGCEWITRLTVILCLGLSIYGISQLCDLPYWWL